MFVGTRSGDATSSLKVRLPLNKSRMTNNDHLSPTRSRVLAIAQLERLKLAGFSMFTLLRSGYKRVACILQVAMVPCQVTCVLQVTITGDTPWQTLPSRTPRS